MLGGRDLDQIEFALFLDYIYNRFAATFVLCIVGAAIKNITINAKHNEKISIGEIIISSIFSTALMCAIRDYIGMPFSVYVVASMIAGMWGAKFIALASDNVFMKKAAKTILKSVSNPVTNAVSNALDEENKDDKPADVDKNKDKE